MDDLSNHVAQTARRKLNWWRFLPLSVIAGLFLLFPTFAFAADEPSGTQIALDTVWVIFASVLVFFMQAGFAMLEAGFARAKNVGNIVVKNLVNFSIASIVFWAVGFAITFGTGNSFFGTSGWLLNVSADQIDTVFSSLSWSTVPLMAKFLFQVVFLGVSLAIVWGALLERSKFAVYIVVSIVFSALIYPVVGHWIWGGGWLGGLGMQDFAGSTVVHSVGAWTALAGVLLLGPRIGKYRKDGSVNPIPGHNMPFTMLGVMILWLGWFGFNPGSTMAATLSIADIAVTTNLAAAAGVLGAMFTSWALMKKPDIGMIGNGAIAGLVAITAPCAFVENWAAVVIGGIAGTVMVFAVLWLDKKIDDPIGAVSCHGISGVLGTLLCGVFASPRLVEAAGIGKAGLLYTGDPAQLIVQAIGVAAVFGFVLVSSLIMFYLIKVTIGLRVSEKEEIEGLDINEHGMWGYPDNFITSR